MLLCDLWRKSTTGLSWAVLVRQSWLQREKKSKLSYVCTTFEGNLYFFYRKKNVTEGPALDGFWDLEKKNCVSGNTAKIPHLQIHKPKNCGSGICGSENHVSGGTPVNVFFLNILASALVNIKVKTVLKNLGSVLFWVKIG